MRKSSSYSNDVSWPLAGSVIGQGKYLTNEGNIIFYSHTAIEDITAENREVASVIDVRKRGCGCDCSDDRL